MDYNTRLKNAHALVETLKTHSEPVDCFINWLETNQVKMVCFDYDRTILDFDTEGCYSKSRIDKLKEHISPDFLSVADKLKEKEIKMCVVTFSDFKAIRFNDKHTAGWPLVNDTISDRYPNVKIYARNAFFYQKPSEYKALGLTGPMHISKNYHMEQAAKDHGLTLKDIILVDDDYNNCRQAKKIEVVALNVYTDDGFNLRKLRII